MGLLSFLGLGAADEQSRRLIIEFATVQHKRVEPAHQESATLPFPTVQTDLLGASEIYTNVPVSVPTQYEFVLKGEVHGVFTYCSREETFRQLWEKTIVGDRVEVDYIPRALFGDLIVGVREAYRRTSAAEN